MAKDYQQLWKGFTNAADEAEGVRALAEIVINSGGRAFILRLESKDVALCVETLDHVSCDLHLPPFPHLRWSRQGVAKHNLKTVEKNAFLLTLRRLAERHDLLPDRMMIREKIEVSDKIVASGGFGDVRPGVYMGGSVAVKTVRIASRNNLQKIRKVRICGVSVFACGTASTILPQRFYREAVLWDYLSHPNVLKLVGVQENVEKGQFITVSEWMAHGTIMDYIKKNHTNRLELVRGFTSPNPFTEMR